MTTIHIKATQLKNIIKPLPKKKRDVMLLTMENSNLSALHLSLENSIGNEQFIGEYDYATAMISTQKLDKLLSATIGTGKSKDDNAKVELSFFDNGLIVTTSDNIQHTLPAKLPQWIDTFNRDNPENPIDDYTGPSWGQFTPLAQFVYSDDDMKPKLNALLSTVAKDDNRLVLTHVLAKCRHDEITLTSADGYQLTTITLPSQLLADNTHDILISADTVKQWLKANNGDVITLSISDDGHMLKTTIGQSNFGGMYTVSNLLDGQYPDYRAIIPNKNNALGFACISHNVAIDLLNAIKFNQVMAADSAKSVNFGIFTLNNDCQLRLSAESQERGQTSSIIKQSDYSNDAWHISHNGDNTGIALNIDYLKKAIEPYATMKPNKPTKKNPNPTDHPYLNVYLFGIGSPAIIEYMGITTVIMPMSTDNGYYDPVGKLQYDILGERKRRQAQVDYETKQRYEANKETIKKHRDKWDDLRSNNVYDYISDDDDILPEIKKNYMSNTQLLEWPQTIASLGENIIIQIETTRRDKQRQNGNMLYPHYYLRRILNSVEHAEIISDVYSNREIKFTAYNGYQFTMPLAGIYKDDNNAVDMLVFKQYFMTTKQIRKLWASIQNFEPDTITCPSGIIVTINPPKPTNPVNIGVKIQTSSHKKADPVKTIARTLSPIIITAIIGGSTLLNL
jgi:DNA polymerase III sliding clamp (beta) subunit (PCNA family)